MSVSDEIIKVLDALTERFGIAVDWTSENVIPYLEQICGKYVNYEIATSAVWMIIGIILLILAIILPKRIKNSYDKSENMEFENGYSWLCILLSVFFVFSIIGGIGIVIQQTFDIVTCYTFPEKIIIEELKTIYTNLK